MKSREFRYKMGPYSHYNVRHTILCDCVLSGEGTICYRAEFAEYNVKMYCTEKFITREISNPYIFAEKIR